MTFEAHTDAAGVAEKHVSDLGLNDHGSRPARSEAERATDDGEKTGSRTDPFQGFGSFSA